MLNGQEKMSSLYKKLFYDYFKKYKNYFHGKRDLYKPETSLKRIFPQFKPLIALMPFALGHSGYG
jgi:hypothetical protein